VLSALPYMLVRSELITTEYVSIDFYSVYHRIAQHILLRLAAVLAKMPAIEVQECVQVLIHMPFTLGSHEPRFAYLDHGLPTTFSAARVAGPSQPEVSKVLVCRQHEIFQSRTQVPELSRNWGSSARHIYITGLSAADTIRTSKRVKPSNISTTI
jgi:hypothetical protein